MELALVDLNDPIWQRYLAVKPGLFNYAVLKLGSHWTPSRLTDPERNQQLELEYIKRRSWRFDITILWRSLGALLRSGGNIKARKPPDVD
jgi:lipopolysaccharide/colanic/teichoic acid biosynthesis glycosyltransferase